MMFSSTSGEIYAIGRDKHFKKTIVGISAKGDMGKEFKLTSGTLTPVMSFERERAVEYIAGPSGSGKSTMIATLLEGYIALVPKAHLYLFSRSDQEDDKAFANIDFEQVMINESLYNMSFDVTKIKANSVLIFDDIGTIHNDKLRKTVEKIVMDALEVGRKYKINIIITNHLVIPNDRQYARVVMNELQFITLFPKSGSTQQMEYVLTKYCGVNKKDIQKILNVDSRWVRIHNRYPRFVLYDKGGFML